VHRWFAVQRIEIIQWSLGAEPQWEPGAKSLEASLQADKYIFQAVYRVA